MSYINITKDNFVEEVINSDKPVLLDFWASWCGPCRMLAPTIAALGEKYEGKVKICKVDVDAQPELAARFGVMSIPTLVVLENGKEVTRVIGLRPMEAIERLLV